MAVFAGAAAARLVLDENGDFIPGVGLLEDTLIMVKISVWGPLVLARIYVATFSSALGMQCNVL
jgi:hypothetical protein